MRNESEHLGERGFVDLVDDLRVFACKTYNWFRRAGGDAKRRMKEGVVCGLRGVFCGWEGSRRKYPDRWDS